MLRFNHEMNGWWYPWGEGRTSSGAVVNGNSAGDFVKAWRHVHDIFTRVGARNVSWLWNPNMQSRATNYAPLWRLYPGNAYVDWTGLSLYNKGSWLWPSSLLTGSGTSYMANSYQSLVNVAPYKPMILAETGSVEAGDGGTKKATWIRDMLANQIAYKYPKIKGFLWFDWSTSGYWSLPVDSSKAALYAYQHAVRSSLYAGSSFGTAWQSPIPPLRAG